MQRTQLVWCEAFSALGFEASRIQSVSDFDPCGTGPPSGVNDLTNLLLLPVPRQDLREGVNARDPLPESPNDI